MPISAERMKLYPGGSIKSPEWLAIRGHILKRAENCCEFCRVPNGRVIVRGQGSDAGTFGFDTGELFDENTGEQIGWYRGSEYDVGRVSKIVLTIMHLDHDPGNCADDNLKAACQMHHLRYDAKFHAQNAAVTRRAKSSQADFFA